MDTTVFAMPKEKRGAWLAEKKDYIIKRLNADFQKPWVSIRMVNYFHLFFSLLLDMCYLVLSPIKLI